MAPPPPTSSGGNDPLTQMNTYRSYVTMLADPGAKDEIKLKAAQELSENFEIIMGSSQYPAFLEHSMKIFLKILQDGEPHFIAEYNIQQVRKLILEMIHRLPTNEHLRPFVKQILSLMLHLLETENEENVLVCLHIIIELHKQFRPTFNPDILHFLQFVKCIYRELPNHLNKIFEPRPQIRVKDLSEVNIEALLSETFTLTAIQSEKKTPDGTAISYNLIPKAVLSLKVLQELPILVVLMYQLYKQNIHQDFADFIPLVMTTITLQPAAHHRLNPAFNREVFVDFMGAQIKTLSFLAYIIRVYQEVVSQHSSLMVKGMLGLLTLCPMEVAHLRKELLIAARHILATDLRIKFVPYMERLFDERVLLGRGWTTHESLRPLAYSTLADLVHHVRQHLPLSDLARAVHLFSKNVHDESLPTSIQTMSCKLLLNLVDCIRQRSEAEVAGQCRELLMRMLEVFVLKFKTIAKLQLPVLMNKFSAPAPTSSTTPTTTAAAAVEDTKPAIVDGIAVPSTPGLSASSVHTLNSLIREEKDRSRFGFPASQAANYSVTDCRSLVKTLVCGVKTITWGCASCKVVVADGSTTAQNKHFQPKETLVFVRLVRWALQALDVYTITPPNPVIGPLGNVTGVFTPQVPQPPRPSSIQQVRSKEEKEVLEHFAGVFALMNQQTFQEIFSTTIEYMVERIHHNYSLQIIGNSFLANPSTSPVFATVLVRYLLERMEEMGQGTADRSNLYLKLFKLVFGSVSLFPTENEQMLRPHLHQIVNRSMELAMTAKEPYNYFLLLRALFRSIGGGSHDLLYQEFLPLLPNLLQGLNSLQSGLHKQHMKDLFVELCLTVPVRLSSLLPYLPMLMDPLVSALNGSHTLISQGLRTLELCVDNLQPDFLYEHIQPVRADLMQALWRTLRNPTDQVAHVAFRVLGKFGGGNRKMMIEPQKLEYNERETSGPAIVAHFQDHKTPIAFPVEKVIDTAFSALKSSTTDPFYRRQCWEVIRCYLVASLNLEDDRHIMLKLLTHPSYGDGKIPPIQGPVYKSPDKQTRTTHQTALTGMFVAAAIKEVSQFVLPTMVALVRHYTLVAISQQAGPFPVSTRQSKLTGMDPLVLIDSLAVIMGHEEKELCKPGQVALVLILEMATSVLGSRERACRLPLMEYLAESMCSLCYDRAWYAKLGGCIAIKFLFERMATQWVFEHLYLFLKALLFVMMDLTGEVSSGAIDMAKANLERMLIVCAAPLPEGSSSELEEAQKKSLSDVTHELVRQVTSPNTLAREQAMHSLEVIAKIQGRSVTEVMEPHKEVLADMIPPKKHLLRHQPANAQIGLMDGNTFCTTLQPRLFTIDLNIEEHKIFFHELMSLCEMDDTALLKLPCYKSLAATGGGSGSAVIGGVPGSGGVGGVSGVSGSGSSGSNPLIPLRRSALRALAACHYVVAWRERIFHVLYRALERPHPELREAAFGCMKRFIAGFQIEMEMVHAVMRPLLLTLADYRYFNLSGAKHLSYLTQLFPTTFNEKLCEHLLQHLKKLLDAAIVAYRNGTRSGDNEERIATIIGIFHQIPAASARLLEMLCRIVLQAERGLLVEAGSPFRAPLLKFLLRYPSETIDVFLQENNIKDQQWSRFFEFLIKHKDGKPFRDVLQNSSVKLMNMALGLQYQTALLGAQPPPPITPADKPEIQYQSIRITSLLIKFDDQWLINQHQLVSALKNIWCSEEYQEKHKRVDAVDFQHWKEPKLLVKILLQYFCHHPTEVDLLFQLLRALCDRFIPDFQFLRDFLENTVAASYTVEWKRAAFFRFVEAFQHDHSQAPASTETPTNGAVASAAPASPHNSSLYSQELKARVLQYILIPCFAVSFERGEGERLVGGPPAPDQDNPENVVSVFISRVIDPENPFGTADSVRILLLQFSCLLVEQASPHIHDAANKRQGSKLRRLMTFAWPCLLGKNCVDPATRYHGHLLLSHIIAKFAIHKRIVLQVFHGLLKAHAVEARNVVRQALEILTPSVPVRMEDGNTMLTHWTKKIIVEEGHTMGQLFHILQLVVRHYKVYYPVRHHLVQHMVASIQRLGFSPTASLEHRKLAVELAEVIVKWELQRIKDECTTNLTSASPAEASPISASSYHHDHPVGSPAMVTTGVKRSSTEDPGDGPPRKRHTSGQAVGAQGGSGVSQGTQAGGGSGTGVQTVLQQKVDGSSRPIERAHADAVLNFLFRLACMVNDQSAAVGSPGEMLSRRCVALLKAALKPDVWPAPQCDIKLAWLDKLFAGVESASGSGGGSTGVGGMAGMSGGFGTLGGSQPNYANICTALDLLTFLVTVLRKEQILVTFRPLQRGISACMTCPNLKVIKLVHGLLTRLMSIFPTEVTNSPVASRYEDLECLYACVNKVVLEGLSSYEKSPSGGNASGSSSSASNTPGNAVPGMAVGGSQGGVGSIGGGGGVNAPSSLFGTLMVLKAACAHNPCYIDRLITSFMRVLQRMTREHLSPGGADSSLANELLVLSLDLVKNRVGVMGVEMRKAFIGNILVGLIEKTPDVKVMKTIIKMLEEWMKNKNPIAVNQGPSLREKSILLVKLMQYVEKRFPDDLELNAQFLEIVNFVYRDESLKTTELTSKLEPAFLAGLRCVQPFIRAKFFEVFDGSMRRRLHDRLLYIVCSQNWESMGAHFWIKQCIELILVTCVSSYQIQISSANNMLPGICSVINFADSNEKAKFVVYTTLKEEPVDPPPEANDSAEKEDDIDMESVVERTQGSNSNVPGLVTTPRKSSNGSVDLSGVPTGGSGLQQLIARQAKFIESAREVRSSQLLIAAAQLCHMDSSLAEQVWVAILPRIWRILSEKQQTGLSTEIVPFLCSGAHVVQKDCHPSALNVFVEALSQCSPPIVIKPCLMKYLGKSHNLWHRMVLSLEQMAFEVCGDGSGNSAKNKRELGSGSASANPGSSPGQDCYDFEAVNTSPIQEIYDSLSDLYTLLCEEDMWAGLWQRSWGGSNGPPRYRETAVALAYEQQGFFERAQNAYENVMAKARQSQEQGNANSVMGLHSEYALWEKHWIRCSKELNQWELLLEYGNMKGCNNPFLVLESSWRIPNWPLMKEALSLVELSCPKEMAWKVNLYRGFLAICYSEEQHLGMVKRHVEAASGLCMREWRRLPRVVSHAHLPLLQAAQQIMELQEALQIHQGLLHSGNSSLHDMKAIVKTWRNRLPVIADDLSHWSDIFTWRQHHYQFIASHYDSHQGDAATNHSMLGVHASAQAIIHFGKVARKHNLTGVCLDSLSRIYTIPSVPIVDCFQKIRQQVKCYLQMAQVTGKNELQEGLEVIESTNLKYFTKEMTAEFYALKGMLLAQIGRSEDANKAFSGAVQMHDTLVKAWALWGDYLEGIFTRDARQLNIGVSAITCFLHACRHQNESKSRKYLAKVLWLLTYEDEECVLTQAVDKWSVGVPPAAWLPWVPQLLTCLVRAEGRLVLNLLSSVGRVFPQAVYFPIRTLYLTLKIEQRERYKSAELAAAKQVAATAAAAPPVSVSTTTTTATATPVKVNSTGEQVQQSSEVGDSTTTPQSTGTQVGGAQVPGTPTQPQAAQQQQRGAGGETGPIRATPPMWRCSRIMHMQRDIHPTVLSSLEGIVDQMVWFRENWYEEVLRQLRQGLAKCHAIAFENRGAVTEATITPHTLNFVKKLVSTFGIGIENINSSGSVSTTFGSAASESLARRAQATVQDPVFQRMKGQFSSDFDFSVPGAVKLHNLIHKLKKWIKILEAKTKLLPKSFLVEEKCRFLSNFSLQTAEVELPGEFLLPKHSHYYVRISRFMPRVEIVQKHNTAARRLYIRGHNGKIYPYLVVNDSGLGDARREERVLQLLRMLNHYLGKQKETSRRFLHITVPRVVAVSPQMRLVEDSPSSISLLDIYKRRCARRGMEYDAPVARYYERLAAVQARGSQASHQVLRDILREVQNNMVPRSALRDWATHTFQSATDYWTFRKTFILQLALAAFAEYVLHLTRLNPDMMYIHQDSGLINVSYFKFDVDDGTGELDANRPVPFRLTPNIFEFVTTIGVGGPLTASMIAAARCLVTPGFKVQTILRAVLRDEMIAWHKKKQDDTTETPTAAPPDMEGELLVNMVSRAVSAVMNRLQSLATFEGTDSKVSTLVAAANSHDNLCRMDPAWHPWL